MATEVNAQGLLRPIPAATKRAVRKRCGFGCVICGLGFYDYEHFDPDFKDATSHDPAGITLLCSQCNQKRARGTLSRVRVAKANEAPACLQAGYTREWLDLSAGDIQVELGNVLIRNCPDHLFSIEGKAILSIRRSGDPDEPLLLSGSFTDVDGKPTLEIVDNEWTAQTSNWDVEVVGSRITIRRGHGDIVLQVKTEVPHTLKVERLDMRLGNWRLNVSEDHGIRSFLNDQRALSIAGLELDGAGQVAAICLNEPLAMPPAPPSCRGHIHVFGKPPGSS
jgi:hypothetical protein